MAKKVCCPKCGCKDLLLTELWKNHAIQWQYIDGELQDSGNMEVGDPYKVEAFCNDCDHEWRLRGVIQITDIID